MSDHIREFGSPIEAKNPNWNDFMVRGIPEGGDSQDHVRQPALQGEIGTGFRGTLHRESDGRDVEFDMVVGEATVVPV